MTKPILLIYTRSPYEWVENNKHTSYIIKKIPQGYEIHTETAIYKVIRQGIPKEYIQGLRISGVIIEENVWMTEEELTEIKSRLAVTDGKLIDRNKEDQDDYRL